MRKNINIQDYIKKYRADLSNALNATAKRYRNPFNLRFFTITSCPMCGFVMYECALCSLNIDIIIGRAGCTKHKNYRKLSTEMTPYYASITQSFDRTFSRKKPTAQMIKRAEVLERAAKAVMRLTEKELEVKDFRKIHKIVK